MTTTTAGGFLNNFLSGLDDDRKNRDKDLQTALQAVSNSGDSPTFNHVGGDYIDASENTGTIVTGVANTGKLANVPGWLTDASEMGTSLDSSKAKPLPETHTPAYIAEDKGAEESSAEESSSGSDTTSAAKEEAATDDAVKEALRKYNYKGKDYKIYNGELGDYDYSARHRESFSRGNATALKAGDYSKDELSAYMEKLADEGAHINYRGAKAMGHEFAPTKDIQNYDAATADTKAFDSSDAKHLLHQGYDKEAVLQAAQAAQAAGNLTDADVGAKLVDGDSDWYAKKGRAKIFKENAVSGLNWENERNTGGSGETASTGGEGKVPKAKYSINRWKEGTDGSITANEFTKDDAKAMLKQGFSAAAVQKAAAHYGSDKFANANAKFYSKKADDFAGNTTQWKE